jgi:lauroyl/myristoyl acyltransferase
VALLVDGDVATARVPAQLAGRPALLPFGPARLVARTRAALFSGRCERGPGGDTWHVRLEELAPGLDGAPEARLHEAVAGWLERTVLEDPGRWCMFRSFFAAAASAATAPAQNSRQAA